MNLKIFVNFCHVLSIKNFYVRRVLRIWPLYYLFIVLCLVLVSDPLLRSSTIFYYLFFTANVPFIMFAGIPILVHLWSIGVEEQFYLMWPWVVKFSSQKLLLITITIIFLLIGLTLVARFSTPEGSGSILYRAINVTRFQCMLIGAAGAILYKQKHKLFLRIMTNKTVQIISWGIIFLVTINRFHIFRAIDHDIIAVVALALILGQVSNKNKIFNLENRVFDYLGKISYGIYVYHPLLIWILLIVVNRLVLPDLAKYIILCCGPFGFTILIAHVSYKYFEKPFLRLKRRFTTVESANSMLAVKSD